MHFKPKKFLSLLTASLLAAGGLVGLAAAPAMADAPAPATLFNYESNTVGQNGWANMLGYTSASDNSAWGNYVDGAAGLPVGGSAAGTIGVKGQKGNAVSNTAVGSIADGSSLVSSTTLRATMNFYAPEAGKVVRLNITKNDYSGTQSADATDLTVVGWQVLTFNFSNTIDFTQSFNRANISYDPASTVGGSSSPNYVYYYDDVSFNGAPAAPISPATLFNYESNTVGQNGWANMLGYTSASDNSAWGNYVDAGTGLPAGGSVTGTKAVKGQKGNATSNTGVGSIAANASLISASRRVATMNFYAPEAGKIVALNVTKNDYSGTQTAQASSLTVVGWQVLTFTFSAGIDFTQAFNRANVSYDTASTVGGASSANYVYYYDDVSFGGATAAQIASQLSIPTVNYDIRLQSSLKDTAVDAYEWTDCGGAGWCVNNAYFMKMIAAGSSTTVTYKVTEHGTTTPISGATVDLRMNTGYSGSNATWSSGGTTFGAVSSTTANDAGVISGTTNGQGEVSFTFTNTNTTGEATRTLNNANPYPSGCSSPAGQTKAALQPVITGVTGANLGIQYVDVLWPHITSSTIESSIAAGSDGTNCGGGSGGGGGDSAPAAAPVSPYDMGRYPHIRLERSLLNNKYDASWWDGVWQFRDADTQAYLKYIPVGSTFTLTYIVTDENSLPLADAPVSLIVNANYSCSKTFFAYEGSLIGPDDCAGGGETELPAKKTDSNGRVSFVLTNTNTTGEAMPADLNGLPNGKELGTNIKPNLVGAKRQGIDMLFAHFVESSDANKVTGPGTVSATIGKGHYSTFTFLDAAGKALANTDIKYNVNGFDSKTGFASTDAQGRVTIFSTNSSGQAGMQTVGVSFERDGKLPLFATATINWEAPALAVSAAGSKGAVVVKVAGAAGKTVKITIAGKVYTRVAKTENAQFSFATSAGKKAVKVSVAGKTLSKSVTVTKK